MLKKLFPVLFSVLLFSFPHTAFALDRNFNTRIQVISTPTPTESRMRTITISTPTPTESTRRIQTIEATTTPSPTPTPTPSVEFQKISISAISSAAALLGEITESETATREGKPVYIFTTREKLKLFGLIPIEGRATFEVDAGNHAIRKTNRPWWSFLTIKPNWATFFSAMGPNLTITDVTWDKKSYHAGDMATMRFNIKNTGTEKISGMFDIVWREGEKALGYYKNFYAFLNPGESVLFNSFAPQPYVCDKTIFLEIDETNKVKETTKKDNVWQGVTTCAPTTGPDLTGSIKLENSFFPAAEKRVGAKNTVTYTIQNVGIGVSEKTRALMKTTSGQYLALIDVPPMLPFLQTTGKVNYTPNDCSPIELTIDPENKNTEPEENNNVVTEPAEVTDHCNKGPDLSFGVHYWTSKDGYSFGKPHANGEALLFQVEMINSATDQTWGCARNVTLGVFENDTLFTTFNEGNFGFGSNCPQGGGVSGTYDHPTTTKTQKFYYPAKCGATVKLVIDPDMNVPETDKSNNTWSNLIECQP